ncbi:hypothetical protein HAX54_026274 [Datura stramonium]|uniref:SKP1-like protein n=2 Tax=Datura stramonium TaxID=4076 RepID=A0ABS8V2G7_DATST|nr:hypothetical protein [Datura stramonium]
MDRQSETSTSSSVQYEYKLVDLVASDGRKLVMEESHAIQSLTLKSLMEDGSTEIPLPNVDYLTLSTIIGYLEKHGDQTDENVEEIKQFDKDFVKKSFNERFEVLSAANYLNIRKLVNLIIQSIADDIKDKSVVAVRKIFKIANDYALLEEAEVLIIRDFG